MRSPWSAGRHRWRSSSSRAAAATIRQRRGVLGRRTFTTKGTDLTDFVDDLEPGAEGREALRDRRRPFDDRGPRGTASRSSAHARGLDPKAEPEPAPESADPAGADAQSRADREGRADVRARAANRRPAARTGAEPLEARARRSSRTSRMPAASARRTDAASTGCVPSRRCWRSSSDHAPVHLTSVLATLQPDQYELVTWPAEQPLIVHGQPGHRQDGRGDAPRRLPDPPGTAGWSDRSGGRGRSDRRVPRSRPARVEFGRWRRRARCAACRRSWRGSPRSTSATSQPGPHDRVGVQWNVWSDVHRAARVMGVAGSGDVKSLPGAGEGARHRQRDPSDVRRRSGAVGVAAADRQLPEGANRTHDYLPFLATAGARRDASTATSGSTT